MNVGDSVPVIIAGQVVANASVKEMGDGTATLIIPATRVVMAVRTELAYEAPQVQEQTTETIITGVDRADGAGEAATVPDLTNVVGETVAPTAVETPVTEPVVSEGVGTDVTTNVETANESPVTSE